MNGDAACHRTLVCFCLLTNIRLGMMNLNHRDIAIIGGGIAALSAAWRLQQQQIPYAIYERADRWGGKIHTEHVTVNDGTFILDAGPESFVTRKPEVWELAQQIGLQAEVMPLKTEIHGAHVLHQGVAYPLPLSPLAFIRSPLLSWRGKLRVLAEPFIAPRCDHADESLADFARRRLGPQMTDRIIGPVLGGIYNTDYEQQSVLVSAPQMRQIEREHGSLVRGFIAAARRPKVPDAPPRFMAFQNGAETLVNGLLARLNGSLHLNASVEQILPAPDGGYELHLQDGRRQRFQAVILATPANVSATLLQTCAPAAAEQLAQLEQSSIGTLFLAFRAADLTGLRASSLMIPRREQRVIDALLWTSKRMPARAPNGYDLLKIFFGGALSNSMTLDDEALLHAVLTELRTLLGIQAVPILHRIYRWQNSYPRAQVGHLSLVGRAEAALPPGLLLAGSSFRGIGVPDCIRQGYEAADAALRGFTRQM